MSQNKKNEKLHTPREFLRARRPERFSDSISEEIGNLDRAVLEHHLDTLNRRSQELAFEDFAKQLCEKVICPNLQEQTGPVAGGDGKVDTQTFPVSEQSSVLWYVGVNESADRERWAFAISTQENWRQKCRTDVRKVVGTERGYTKVFCITSRYAKSNQRSEVEDALSKEFGIEVRILDASWILDQVFKNGYERLAIDLLSVAVDWRREVTVGPNDYAKTLRLDEVEKEISESVDPTAISVGQLDLLLESAILSKELEHPHIESQGKFDRAVKAAHRFGNNYQQFRAHYQYAWAAYWWYEDIQLFEEEIGKSFEAAQSISQYRQWGDLGTLLGVYIGHCRRNSIEMKPEIVSILEKVDEFLKEMAADESRPSNSLMARANVYLLEFHQIKSLDQASDFFKKIRELIQLGDGLVGFPFQELYELISSLDDFFSEDAEFESLLDLVTEKAVSRYGELKASLLFLKRGAAALDSGRPYQAIKLVGKSLVGLYKEESRGDIVSALYLLSEAYRQVSLVWAARAALLLAASLITQDYWQGGELISAQIYAYHRLAEIELQLGRISYALVWWQLARAVDQNVEGDFLTEKDLFSFDGFLSKCILNSSLSTLGKLEKFPDLLDSDQLYTSRACLLVALGYPEVASGELEVDLDEEFTDYLCMLRDLDFGADVPDILLQDAKYISLSSSVLGCLFKVSFPNRSPTLELAETLLSVIESFFSTGMIDQVMTLESCVEIHVSVDDEEAVSITHELDDSGSTVVFNVMCSSFSIGNLDVSGQKEIQKWLHEFVLEILARVYRPKNPKELVETLIGGDRALERSVSFGACFASQQNILGDDYLHDIQGVAKREGLGTFSLLRSQNWDKDFPKNAEERSKLGELKPGEGMPPQDLMDYEKLRHRDMTVQGLIKVRLWDRTTWRGVAFFQIGDNPPGLALMFEDLEAGSVIFRDLMSELGGFDERNRLRITIVRNIDVENPAHYRVCIAENIDVGEARTVQMVARLNTMTPDNENNLERFIADYKKYGCFYLAYAGLDNGRVIPGGGRGFDEVIKLDNINIVEAWTIGPNDIDSVAISSNDNPKIPPEVKDPPVLSLMKIRFNRG